MFIIGIIFVIIGIWLLHSLYDIPTLDKLYTNFDDVPGFETSIKILKFISILLIIGGFGLLI